MSQGGNIGKSFRCNLGVAGRKAGQPQLDLTDPFLARLNIAIIFTSVL